MKKEIGSFGILWNTGALWKHYFFAVDKITKKNGDTRLTPHIIKKWTRILDGYGDKGE